MTLIIPRNMTSIPPTEGEMAIEANGTVGIRSRTHNQDRCAEPLVVKKVFSETEVFGYGYGGPKGTGKPRVGANAVAVAGYIKKKGKVVGVEGAALGVSTGVNAGFLGGVGVGPDGIINCIDNFDRPGDASATGTYHGTEVYAHGGFIIGHINKTGERVPKAGAWWGAGVGLARAAISVLEVEAKGPNVSAEASATILGAGAMARAEVGSVSITAGPVRASLGLGVDTGVSAGVDGVEVKLLGTGLKLGPRPSVAVLGSKAECSIL
ncbi:uncharacterized protein LOC114839478 [Esox lucius]|uniref:Uncharacterized protein n=2 Tax=Esox lucius TaxID=8010 RepID=A0A6Q2XIV4_ESOLU|nr:uncharacterized protein LOC114839478 [Esox lucius]